MAKKTGGLGADAIFAARAPAPPNAEPVKPQADPEEPRSSNVTLPARIWEWIDDKHAQQRSHGGAPLRKAAVIRSVFEVAMGVDVDLTGCQTEEEVVARFRQALERKYRRSA